MLPGDTAGGTQAGHDGREVDDLEVAGVQCVQAVACEDVVQVPGEADAVVGVHRGGGAGDIHGAADVREDQAVLLHGPGDDLRLRGHVVDQSVDGRRVLQAQPGAEGQIVGALRRVNHVRAGINILRVDVAGRQGHAQGVVDGALASLRDRQPFIGPDQAGQDRQSRGVRGRIAEGAEGVRVHVPDGFLGRVPLAVGMGKFHAARIGEQGRVEGRVTPYSS